MNDKGGPQKNVTIKDIAAETGLGLATISKYLNGGNVREKNKLLIEEAVDRLGFTVNEFARGLKTSRSRSIGVVIPDLKNVFITTIISTAEDILRSQGYSTLICDCQEDVKRESEVIRFLMNKRVDGIINMPISENGKHLKPANACGVPVVLIDRMIEPMQNNMNAVLVDNAGGAFKAISSLLDAGHRRIGAVLGPANVFTSAQRHLGYMQAMEKHGVESNEKHVIYSDYKVQGGYESIKRLLAQDITAVFVSNYEMTLGAVIAVNENRVVIPDELSFIGFDNQHLLKAIRPSLSIVTQPLEEIGKAAAEILMDRLKNKNSDNKIITLPTGMIQGDSIKIIENKTGGRLC